MTDQMMTSADAPAEAVGTTAVPVSAAPDPQPDLARVAADTAVQVLAAAAPAALGVAAASDPKVAAALQLAPLALNLLSTAQQLTQAGAMSPAALADLFEHVGAGIKAQHAQWAQMDQAKPV